MFRVCVMMVVVVGDGKSGWGLTICYANEDYDHKGKLVTMLAYILGTLQKNVNGKAFPHSAYTKIYIHTMWNTRKQH